MSVPSAPRHHRHTRLALARQGPRHVHVAMMVTRTPMVIAALAQTVRSDRSNRWTTFWIVMGILAAIAAALEILIVRRNLRRVRRDAGLDAHR